MTNGLPSPGVPVNRAALCPPPCDTIFDSSDGACPKCGSEHFHPIPKGIWNDLLPEKEDKEKA